MEAPTAGLALFWHQHQPYYPDDVSRETLMPWVRLHGTKDYIGMALHLKEVPEFRCTINLVPSLLVQILAYTENQRSDRHLDVSRAPADGLSEEDAVYLLDHFFMANADNMIRPYPRYRKLYLKRDIGAQSAASMITRFSEQEFRDLQVWNNLTWFHPLLFERDTELAEFLKQGQNWTESDKNWLLDKQLEVLAEIIPLHKELEDAGQIEITTTPFYHPILPLLWDKRSAREAMPNCPLPNSVEPYRDDAAVHVRRAVEFHQELFGRKPRGMWPSEGSVSQEIIPVIAEQGLEWIATDEEILAHSTGGWVSRDGQGHVRNPEMLFRPWRLEEGGYHLGIVFRDHAMSDLIGFHYQRSDPTHAAHDLLGKVEGIGRATADANGGRPALVPIILDGENCWEYYPDGGVKFLRTLYREAARHPKVGSYRIGDYLREFPPTDKINRLFAGSWISHNFAIWIGHQEDRDAWDLLHETRSFLVEKQTDSGLDKHAVEQAWEEIYIAEGSDWFWWYGEDHSSELDALFDQLFRKHLYNVYSLLGVSAPPELSRPICRTETRLVHTQPTSFLTVKLDGRERFFEWINAGEYVSGSQRGTMTLVTQGITRRLLFGFDREHFLLRLDTPGKARSDLRNVHQIRVRFIEPAGTEFSISGFDKDEELQIGAVTGRKIECIGGAVAAVDDIFEMAIHLDYLGLKAKHSVHFFVEINSKTQSVDRVPIEGTIETIVPSRDFETIMWQA
jgi:alpha-amylase/alpha-mannosidase (GH57 family)